MWLSASGGRSVTGSQRMPASVKWFISFLLFFYLYMMLTEPHKPVVTKNPPAPQKHTVVIIRVPATPPSHIEAAADLAPPAAATCPSCEALRQVFGGERASAGGSGTTAQSPSPTRTAPRISGANFRSRLSELVDGLEDAISEQLGRS